MPRLRRSSSTTFQGPPPLELLDAGDPVWSTVAKTTRWLDRHGLTSDRRMNWGPLNRCHMAGTAWALEAGIVREVSWSSSPVVDLVRMREIGLRAGWGGAGLSAERMKAGGVIEHASR